MPGAVLSPLASQQKAYRDGPEGARDRTARDRKSVGTSSGLTTNRPLSCNGRHLRGPS